MSDHSNIEWTDATWNPVTGCTKVSPGCDHCYAETLAERFRGTPGHYYEQGFDVQLRPDKLDMPLRWKRPRRIFVNSMSDLFHDDVPDAFIGCVFHVMARAEHHTFQLLTKRHSRMRSLLNQWVREGMSVDLGYLHGGRPLGAVRHTAPLWTPPPNVWLGVSVENQQWADIRIPALLDTPAAVRFLSMEPLLGPVDIARLIDPERDCNCSVPAMDGAGQHASRCRCLSQLDIGWVIVGGESGRGARPMHPSWARSLRDQCTAAGVPFHFKQWGEWVAEDQSPIDTVVPAKYRADDATGTMRLGKKTAGRELDGRTWDEFPAVAS